MDGNHAFRVSPGGVFGIAGESRNYDLNKNALRWLGRYLPLSSPLGISLSLSLSLSLSMLFRPKSVMGTLPSPIPWRRQETRFLIRGFLSGGSSVQIEQ